MKTIGLIIGMLIITGWNPGKVSASNPATGENPLQRVDQLLQARYPAGAPGIVIGIQQQGKNRFKKGYGWETITGKTPISSSTRFNIASLTKQFTAMAVLQLQAAGKLRLEDPIGNYLPTLTAAKVKSLTIRQLLTHCSGLMDHYAYTDTAELQHAHNQTALDAIRNLDTLYFPAGTRYRYSNTAYCLLGLIVEHCSGLPYTQYMQQKIFEPAGLRATSVWQDNQALPHEAMGYDADSNRHLFLPSGADQHPFFSTEADGGIYTTIDDYLHWLDVLQQGKLFPAALTSEARRLQIPVTTSGKTGYGMGWFVDESTGKQLAYHSGSNGGFNSYSFTIPAAGFAIVIFSNRSDRNLEELIQEILHLLRSGDPDFPKIMALTS